MKVVEVLVKPSSKEQLLKEEDGCLVVRLSSPPVEGRANTELVDLLAKHYKVAKKNITIFSGLSSKHKLVRIS